MEKLTPERARRRRMSVTRKIIQISTCGHDNNSNTQSDFTVFALCDDGTLWYASNLDIFGDLGWNPAQSIPQIGRPS